MALPRLRTIVRAHFMNSLLESDEFDIAHSDPHQLQLMADKLCDEMEGRCIFGAKTFAHVFLTTFLDKYIRPYLIDEYNNPHKVSWIIEIIKTSITFALVFSLFSTTLDIIIRNGLRTALKKYGMDDDSVETIANRVCGAVAFTQDPLSLVELGINDSAGNAAQYAAYHLIHKLPKLKFEPEPDAAPVAHAAHEPVVPGLHHRRPGLRSSSED